MLSRAKKNAREIASCRTACRVYVFVHLGAADIYVSNRKGTMWVDGYRFRYDYAPDDWSNGCINCGPGYYGRDMTCEVMQSALSYARRDCSHVAPVDGYIMAFDPSYQYSTNRLEVLRASLGQDINDYQRSYVTNAIHEIEAQLPPE